MKTRTLRTDVFQLPQLADLSPTTRFIALFLLAGPYISHLPIYAVPDRDICHFCCVSQDEVELARTELPTLGITFEDGFWIIDNAMAVFGYKGPNNQKTLEREFAKLPPEMQKRVIAMEAFEERLIIPRPTQEGSVNTGSLPVDQEGSHGPASDSVDAPTPALDPDLDTKWAKVKAAAKHHPVAQEEDVAEVYATKNQEPF